MPGRAWPRPEARRRGEQRAEQREPSEDAGSESAGSESADSEMRFAHSSQNRIIPNGVKGPWGVRSDNLKDGQQSTFRSAGRPCPRPQDAHWMPRGSTAMLPLCGLASWATMPAARPTFATRPAV